MGFEISGSVLQSWFKTNSWQNFTNDFPNGPLGRGPFKSLLGFKGKSN